MTNPTELERHRTGVPRVAVVGAGLGGLAAAGLLADRGLDVHVLEGSAEPGGRARTTSTPDGHLRNLGPHALYLRGPGRAVLGRLGIDPAGRSPRVHRTRWWVDGEVRSASRPVDVAAMARIVRALRNVGPGAPGPSNTSVADWIDRHGLDPARAAATSRISTYAADLQATTVGLLAGQLRSSPVRYLDGGWAALVAALRRRAEQAGAVVHLARRVEAVVGTDRVRSVVVDGEELAVDAVVLAVGGPDRATRLLAPEVAGSLADATAGTVPVRAACLDVALAPGAGGPPILLGLDRPDYLSDHGAVARLGPAGHTVVHVARHLPSGETGDETTRRELEELLTAARPDWRARVVDVSWKPGLTVTHDLAPVARGGLVGRTPVDAAGLPGLALVGDWVGRRGHLADATLASAEDAASLVADLLESGRHSTHGIRA